MQPGFDGDTVIKGSQLTSAPVEGGKEWGCDYYLEY